MNEKKSSSNSNMKMLIAIVLAAFCLFLYFRSGTSLPSLQTVGEVLGPSSVDIQSQPFSNAQPAYQSQQTYQPSIANSQQVQPSTVVVLPATDNGKQFARSEAGSCVNGKYHIVIWYSDNSTAEYDAVC